MVNMQATLLLPVLLFTLKGCIEKVEEPVIAGPDEISKYLHVASPSWEDQIIYFIVTDRFMDGDTTNNDLGEGEYRPGDAGFWNGGDLRGITEKLNYIRELGATGIWITPPVANQWRNPQLTGTGNHGYWASDFMEVDRHYGTLDDYKQLSASLHKNGMYLIQDVVCNHLGDFYTYNGPYDPDDVTRNFMLHDVPQPTRYPFNHNNALDPEDLEMAIYHFTPQFHDHSDTIKKRIYQFADLDDLNTANPVVREALRASYNHWIREAGVDGFRFDTPHMVEHEFWHDFIHSGDSEEPGVERCARQLGKEHFLTFGETAVRTIPFDDGGTIEAASYLGSVKRPEMTSVLNFPLYSAIGRVFQQKSPTSLMTYRLESIRKYFPDPRLLLNFIDNHDGARFLVRGSHDAFRQALLFIMTLPGIPVIYYGTEQELKGMRQTMFRGGVGSADRDHFDTGSDSFHFVKELIRLRKTHEVFRKGSWKVLRDDPGGPGILAYAVEHESASVYVLLNTSESAKLADNIPSGKRPGQGLKTLFSLSGIQMERTVDTEGNFTVLLEPGEGLVLVGTGKGQTVEHHEGYIRIEEIDGREISDETAMNIDETVRIRGKSGGTELIGLMINGNFSRRLEIEPAPDGTWESSLSLRHQVNCQHRISAVSMASLSQENPVSDDIMLELKLPEVKLADYRDESGDDHGPAGSYRYPANTSFSNQMDIESVSLSRIGSNLCIDLTMSEITQVWLPPNQFDHLLVNIYIDLPGMKGCRLLPHQNAEMPEGCSWDYLVSTAGFSNAVYSAEGAGEHSSGRATGPAASVSSEEKTITFLIASEALGYPAELNGSKVYITTWDGSPGSLRGLMSEPGPWHFSGGSESDPKIMDDTELIVLTDPGFPFTPVN